MNRITRNTLVLAIVMVFLLPLSVDAGQNQTIEGRMEGLDCVLEGHVCPVDHLDPHITYEPDFVLHQGGTKYYLLLDVPRVVKARYVKSKVRVTGEVKAKYSAIKVDTLEVEQAGKFKKVWSRSSQWEEWKKRFYRGPSEGS
jgi:hypothetical protein